MQLKRILTAALLGVLAALAMAVPASAATVKAVCTVSGGAKVTDKAHPGGVQLMGGGGTYTFGSLTFTCAGTAKGAPYTETAVVASQGKFSNVVCGTGTAYSAPGQTTATGTGKIAAMAPRFEYKVQFAGTVGTFHLNNDNTVPKDVPKMPLAQFESADKATPGATGTLYTAGVIQIGPPLPTEKTPVVPPPAGSCTKAFHVTGVIVIDKT